MTSRNTGYACRWSRLAESLSDDTLVRQVLQVCQLIVGGPLPVLDGDASPGLRPQWVVPKL